MTENSRRTSGTSPHNRSSGLMANQVVVSSRHPYLADTPVRLGGSPIRHTSIHMEPGLQSLLIAERHANELIFSARQKKARLMRQAKQESQTEIETFRRKCEAQYQIKLHEATQLEQFQAKLAVNHHNQLQNMEKNVGQQRESLVNFIVHNVINQIPIRKLHFHST